MPNGHSRRLRPMIESLEMRVALSGSSPANVIGTNVGTVLQPRQTSATSVDVAPRNLTPQKHATLFGLFVRPSASSRLAPRVLAARGNEGQALPLRHGRAFHTGAHNQTVAFTKNPQAGLLTTDVTGQQQTTGSYVAQTTLLGDVNGDGQVNLDDLQAFAPSYMSRRGQPQYISSADFNQNGVINLYDAKALLHNIAPLTPKIPLQVTLHLAQGDQAHYKTARVSGGATFKKEVTIVGRTTPGSLVIEDRHVSRLPGGTQDYSFTGPAHATNAQGFFAIKVKNEEGLNNNDLLILDPFGQQTILDFPIFWIPFAAGHPTPG